MTEVPVRLPQNLSLFHLQLPKKIFDKLLDNGIYQISDLEKSDVNNLDVETLLAVGSAITGITSKSIDGNIDWFAYWNSLNRKPLYFAFTIPNRQDICKLCCNLPLSHFRKKFGSLINIPLREGFQSLDDLIDALEVGHFMPSGFSGHKLIKLAQSLLQILDVSKNCNIHSNYLELLDYTGVYETFETAQLEDLAKNPLAYLPKAAASLPVSIFGLGVKTKYLKQLGWQTLKDLPSNWEWELTRVPGLGKNSFVQVQKVINGIMSSIENAELNMVRLASVLDLEVFPDKVDSFIQLPLLEQLNGLLQRFSKVTKNSAIIAIADDRIGKAPSESATLEQLGDRCNITRERIRQLEMRFLKSLRSSLVDPYHNRKLILHPDFSTRFETLSDRLLEREELPLIELAQLVADIWNCSLKEAVAAMPPLIAIIEGSARAVGTLRRLTETAPKVFEKFPRNARRYPISNMGLGKGVAGRCARMGLVDIGNLRQAYLKGVDFGEHETRIRFALEAVSQFSENKGFEQERYCNLMKIALLPIEAQDWRGYIKTLLTDVRQCIETEAFWSNSLVIYDKRTSLPVGERMTLQKLADRLLTHGPSIKKTETEFIARFKEMVIDRNPYRLPATIRQDWLDLWRLFYRTFERFGTNPVVFRNSLLDQIECDPKDLDSCMPLIWAVVSGKLTRKTRGNLLVDMKSEKLLLKPVKLSGFRRQH